ncbi:hypothetical protein [uncultured Sphingomonas sp.]|uniref:hypothetical protein n=1 Tax=uncultured Sphingomonas sp. TaxID=158754 RepID=UPI0035CB3A2F
MAEIAVFTYGLLTSFVLSSASRNQRLQRPNPRSVEYVGYLLCGASGALGLLALGYASLTQIA